MRKFTLPLALLACTTVYRTASAQCSSGACPAPTTYRVTTALPGVPQPQPTVMMVRRGLFKRKVQWVAATPQQYAEPATYQAATPATTPETTTAQTPTGSTTGDPYGFTAWLNATRAAYGLPACGYDPNLESWAAMNSAQQSSSGLGHFVMGPARRQNSAMGAFPGIETMWMNSPAHRSALLDPTIRWVGIAGYGAYWTFNAY